MKKSNIDAFKEKASLMHNNKYDYSEVNSICWKAKINIICKEHGMFSQKPDNHVICQGCPKCGHMQKTSTFEEFVNKANLKHNNCYDYSNVNYINAKTSVDIICIKHGAFTQNPNNHLNGYGCYACGIDRFTTSNEEFVNKANFIHNNLYDYTNVNYINSKTYVDIICKKHGVFKQTPDGHIQEQGCPKCHLSKGEIKISNFLNQHNIEYIPQKTFEGCISKRKLPFDFYLPEKNIAIEYDGEHHFIRNEFFGGNKELELSKIRDEIKDNYCKNNSINLIRIPYYDFNEIETILKDII